MLKSEINTYSLISDTFKHIHSESSQIITLWEISFDGSSPIN
jgi:hypothetical protein